MFKRKSYWNAFFVALKGTTKKCEGKPIAWFSENKIMALPEWFEEIE